MESGKIEGNQYIGRVSGIGYYGLVLVSDSVEANNTQGTTYTKYEDILSGYDGGLDTWIGGDNDNSGYYFDYDERGEIVLRNIEQYPITFNLKGEGTEEKPYLINTVKDWNEATTKVTGGYYFKINNDLDFTGKRFYAMGTEGNHFIGTIDGNNKTIKNITMTGTQNSGVIGYNEGTIKNLNIENVNIKTYAYSGIIGYNIGTIQNLNVKDITVTGVNNYNGGVVGYNTGTLKEIEVQNITVNGDYYIGGITGYNKGIIQAMNIEGINVKGSSHIGGVVGDSYSGIVREITYKGTVEGSSYVGGIIGHNYGGQVNSILAKESNVKGDTYIGGIVGYTTTGSNTKITAVLESGKIEGNQYIGRVSGVGYYGLVLVSDAVEANNTQGTTYTSDDINNLGYYSSLTYNDKPILESATTGDVDESGYYFAYGNDGYIKVVKVGETANIIAGLYPIDDNYTMSSIVGTTDTTAPTCELHYVRAVTNGIQASFSCTDDSGAPTVKSLFDSTASKSATTFDAIGTTKSGSISGNTKTVVSTWNTYNTISQPTPGTCYYFRYGAQDIEGNFSTYVTDLCYTGFSS